MKLIGRPPLLENGYPDMARNHRYVDYEEGYFPNRLRHSFGTGFGRKINISKKSASAQVRRWIKLSDTVLPMLKRHGYKPGLRLLTPAHVKVIVDEFGEP